MHTDFSIPIAAIAVLALLGAIAALAGIVLLVVAALARRKRFLAGWIAALGAAGAVVYLVALLGVSLVSNEQVLPRGVEKYFCEIDCHLAYSVVDVRTAKVLGTGSAQRSAAGEFYVVALRTRFDETTTSPTRPRTAPLRPNPRSVDLIDASGRRYPVSRAGEQALAAESQSAPLDRPLLPGQSYVTQLVFDLPPDAVSPRLLLTSRGWETRWMIGQENSWLHPKTYLALDGATPASAER